MHTLHIQRAHITHTVRSERITRILCVLYLTVVPTCLFCRTIDMNNTATAMLCQGVNYAAYARTVKAKRALIIITVGTHVTSSQILLYIVYMSVRQEVLSKSIAHSMKSDRVHFQHS